MILSVFIQIARGRENVALLSANSLPYRTAQLLTSDFRVELVKMGDRLSVASEWAMKTPCPNVDEGHITIGHDYRVQYRLLREVYIAIVQHAHDSPVAGLDSLERLQHLVHTLCKGSDVTVARLYKKYVELVLGLEQVLHTQGVSLPATLQRPLDIPQHNLVVSRAHHTVPMFTDWSSANAVSQQSELAERTLAEAEFPWPFSSAGEEGGDDENSPSLHVVLDQAFGPSYKFVAAPAHGLAVPVPLTPNPATDSAQPSPAGWDAFGDPGASTGGDPFAASAGGDPFVSQAGSKDPFSPATFGNGDVAPAATAGTAQPVDLFAAASTPAAGGASSDPFASSGDDLFANSAAATTTAAAPAKDPFSPEPAAAPAAATTSGGEDLFANGGASADPFASSGGDDLFANSAAATSTSTAPAKDPFSPEPAPTPAAATTSGGEDLFANSGAPADPFASSTGSTGDGLFANSAAATSTAAAPAKDPFSPEPAAAPAAASGGEDLFANSGAPADPFAASTGSTGDDLFANSAAATTTAAAPAKDPFSPEPAATPAAPAGGEDLFANSGAPADPFASSTGSAGDDLFANSAAATSTAAATGKDPFSPEPAAAPATATPAAATTSGGQDLFANTGGSSDPFASSTGSTGDDLFANSAAATSTSTAPAKDPFSPAAPATTTEQPADTGAKAPASDPFSPATSAMPAPAAQSKLDDATAEGSPVLWAASPNTPAAAAPGDETARAVNVLADVTESISILFEGKEISQYQIMGAVSFTLRPTDDSSDASTPSGTFAFTLLDDGARIDTSVVNKAVCTQTGEHSFTLDLASLTNRESVTAVKYKVVTSFRPVPVKVIPQWQFSPTMTQARIQYCIHPSLPHALTRVSFLVGLDGTPGRMQLQPTGLWNPEQQKLLWKVDTIEAKSGPQALLGRFEVQSQGTRQPVQVKFVCESSNLTGVSVSGDTGAGASAVITGVTHKFSAGTVIIKPEAGQ